MRAFLVTPGYEEALVAELMTSAPTLKTRGRRPGVVVCEGVDDALVLDPVWARQQLPGATLIRGGSAKLLAEAAFTAIEGTLDASEKPLLAQVVTPGAGDDENLLSRAELVGEQLAELLKQRRRRAFRRFTTPETVVTPSDAVVLQLCLTDREEGLISAASPRLLPFGGFDISLWPAGMAEVKDDPDAPSRAYKKLEEAYCWMGAEPKNGDRCVDLGGSPGGWSWTALVRGAFVTSVDRAPLAPPASGHPKLNEIRGNAFTWEPVSAVDWLVCDVICEPQKTVALIDRWLTKKLCRNLVATVKFKGHEGYGELAALKPIFERVGVTLARVKHLVHNKNEVEVMVRS